MAKAPDLRIKDLARPACVPADVWEAVVEDMGWEIVSTSTTHKDWKGELVIVVEVDEEVLNRMGQAVAARMGIEIDVDAPWEQDADWWKQA